MKNTKQTENAKQIIHLLIKHTKQFDAPLINKIIKEYGKKPFLILVGCLLSLRAKDIFTIHVCRNLFKKAKTPQELLSIDSSELEKIIFKIGFYKNKAKALHQVSRTIIDKYGGKVPKSKNELLKIKGIGQKTANLVVGLAFDTPAICVDTHVHRISNRLGIIKTKNVDESEAALEKIIPKKFWIEWNRLLVIWGQNVCTPRAPKCRRCAINRLCDYFVKPKLT